MGLARRRVRRERAPALVGRGEPVRGGAQRRHREPPRAQADPPDGERRRGARARDDAAHRDGHGGRRRTRPLHLGGERRQDGVQVGNPLGLYTKVYLPHAISVD